MWSQIFFFAIAVFGFRNCRGKTLHIFDTDISAVINAGSNAEDYYYLGVVGPSVFLIRIDDKSGFEMVGRGLPIDNSYKVSTFNYLKANNSALLCLEECFLIKLTMSPNMSLDSIEHIKQVIPNFDKSSLFNAYQIPNRNGTAFAKAFLRPITKNNLMSSWIVKETFSESILNGSQQVPDHGLAIRPYKEETKNALSLINIFAFEYRNYAYFLRYVHRDYKRDKDLKKTPQWIWQLTRLCLDDQSNEVRSRASVPLTCDFESKAHVQEVKWKPTTAYFDEDDGKLYVYAQTKVNKNATLAREKLNFDGVCSFDMPSVVENFENAFDRCFRKGAHDIAVHGGRSGTYTCNNYYTMISHSKCGYLDMCNDDCDTNPMYHMETYEPVRGTILAFVEASHAELKNDHGGESQKKTLVARTMVVTKSEFSTTQAYVLLSDGRVNMVFLNQNITDAPHALPAAWTYQPSHVQPISSQYDLMRLADSKSVVLASGSEMHSFKSDCSLYSEDCQQLMDQKSGGQAKRLWSCGWCVKNNSADGSGYSATDQECLVDSQAVFLRDHCPPKLDCFEPKVLKYNESTMVTFIGYFPLGYRYSPKICGKPCQQVKHGQTLTCVAQVDSMMNSPVDHCNVTISIAAETVPYIATLVHACNGQLTVYNVSGPPPATPVHAGFWSKDNWWYLAFIFCGVVLLCLLGCCVCKIWRKCRRDKVNYTSERVNMPDREERGHENPYITMPLLHRRGDWLPATAVIRGALLSDEGYFGVVYKGSYLPPNGGDAIPVAIKILKGGFGDVNQFFQEGCLMKQFNHINVLSLIGYGFDENNEPMIVTPFMARGNMLSYIRRQENNPTLRLLLRFAVEIAEGMNYLHKSRVIHRDLAARNCMCDDNLHVKIGDFGLSQRVYESAVCLTGNDCNALPVRWMALESIEQGEYTFKCDVWSYGVVLWELITRGLIPYAGMTGHEIVTYLHSGRRLEIPPYCPEIVYELMMICWSMDPKTRPSFEDLVVRVPLMIQEMENTENNGNLLDSHSYYNDIESLRARNAA